MSEPVLNARCGLVDRDSKTAIAEMNQGNIRVMEKKADQIFQERKCFIMSASSSTSQSLLDAAPTSLPAMGLAIALVVAAFVAFKAFNEFKAESSLKDAMYDETGINGKYEYKLPNDERVKYSQLKAYLLFLKVNGKEPTAGAKLEMPMDKAREIFRSKLVDEERKRIKTALVRWMIGVIEVLARVERDRPGAARLYEKKLVSEEYWEGVQRCFKETHEVIQEINGEAEFVEAGWGSQMFQQALQLWRVTKIRDQQRSADATPSEPTD